MRKATSALGTAAAGAVLAVGMAAPALAAELADPAGTTPGVESTDGDYFSDVLIAVDAEPVREQPAPWSCGLLRLDGSIDGPGSRSGAWRVGIGASYDLDGGTVFIIPASYPDSGWRIEPFETFTGLGSATDSASVQDMSANAGHPAYTWMADTDTRLEVIYSQIAAETGDGTDDVIVVRLPDGMQAGEYVSLALPMTLAEPAAPGTQWGNAVITNTVCAAGEATRATPERVDAGGVDNGASGLVVMAIGAAAITGSAVHARYRARSRAS